MITKKPEVTFLKSFRTIKKLQLFYINTKDKNQTASQRSKPSSRSVLIDEQSNPWKRLHLQDTLSRHRGNKHFYRYEL